MATNEGAEETRAIEGILPASSDKVTQIRNMLSQAVRAKRSQQAGDLMPDVSNSISNHYCHALLYF